MKQGSIFELNGRPRLGEAIPLALQHVVAMIVGCVTPAIIVASAVPGGGLSNQDKVILIQASLVVAAFSTLLQLFPLGSKTKLAIGSGLPVIMGISFAYVPSMQPLQKTTVLPLFSAHKSSAAWWPFSWVCASKKFASCSRLW